MLDQATLLNRLIADPHSVPLDEIDPSLGDLFKTQAHHGVFRRLRAEDPVHLTRDSLHGPFWSITKFDHIVEVDTSHDTFSSEPAIGIGDAVEGMETPMFIAKDPPVHDVQRRAATPAVSPARLSDLESLIRARVCEILDGLPRNEEFNWVDRVSRELTMKMLATLFDIPLEDRHLLTKWSDAATTTTAAGVEGVNEEERFATLLECLQYFQAVWAERAGEDPRFDFISLLAHNDDTRDLINEPMEFLGNLMLLIVGGNDTTRNSISGGLVALNQNPGEYDKLRADPGLIPNMVSEIIRWQTPLSHMRRLATRDVDFHGKQIKKGDKVVMWYASGNRDSDVITDADRFIIDRDRARHHISFGFGIHRCMGNRVAEMQLRILWEEIMKRFDRIEVVGEPVRVSSNFVNGFDEVPVRIAG